MRITATEDRSWSDAARHLDLHRKRRPCRGPGQLGAPLRPPHRQGGFPRHDTVAPGRSDEQEPEAARSRTAGASDSARQTLRVASSRVFPFGAPSRWVNSRIGSFVIASRTAVGAADEPPHPVDVGAVTQDHHGLGYQETVPVQPGHRGGYRCGGGQSLR